MTPEEHKLIVWMFAKQAQQFKVLVDLLKSKGIAEGDDLQAFDFAARKDFETSAALVQEVASRYASFCQTLGVPFQIPPQNDPPKTQ